MKMFSALSMIACVMLSFLIASEAFQRPTTFNTRKQTQLTMVSGNKANFGIFSPAVVVAKFVLGEAKLNKVSIVPARDGRLFNRALVNRAKDHR